MAHTTTLNPLAFVIRRKSIGYWLLLGFGGFYFVFCALIFLRWVNPSLSGSSDQRVAADSGTYIHMADALREGRAEPWVYAALASFPNTLWAPVFLAFVIPNTYWMAVFNLGLFGISIDLFRRSSDIGVGLLVGLLLLNPTTTISILSVNKEILDLFAVALFCFGIKRSRKWIVCIAMVISLLNRYEVCMAMMVLLVAQSKLNPIRSRRWWTLAVFILLLSVSLPLLASQALANRFEEASSAGFVAFLDTLEMHYLFAVAVVPKILESMFGELLNVSRWREYSLDDLANSYVLFFNNIATLITVLILFQKRLLSVRYNWTYFAALGAILASVSLVIQPRYFYFCYVLLCYQAAHHATNRRRAMPLRRLAEENIAST